MSGLSSETRGSSLTDAGRPLTTSRIRATGWSPNPGDPDGFIAETWLDDPRLRIEFDPPVTRPATLCFSLRARLIETVQLRIERTAHEPLIAFLNLDQPWLIDHQFPYFAVTANPESGEYAIELDCPASGESPVAALEIRIEEEANWRIHCWPRSTAMTIPPFAMRNATIGIHGVTVTPGIENRATPRWGRLRNPAPPRFGAPPGQPRDVVLFSSWIPENALFVGEQFLALFERHHPDSRVLVGVNHGSCPAWIDRLRASSLDLRFRLAPPGVTTDSDAAGFVAALDLLREETEPFHLAWFGHSKGVSHLDVEAYHLIRWTFEKRFWGRRGDIVRFFDDPAIGLYVPHYMMSCRELSNHTISIEPLIGVQRRAPGLIAAATAYAMRAETVRAFCNEVPPSFFTHGVEVLGGNRYFFEWAFPNYPLLQGLEPRIERGVGGTTLGISRAEHPVIVGDERQNHALLIADLARWRRDPAGYALAVAGRNPQAVFEELFPPPPVLRKEDDWDLGPLLPESDHPNEES